MSNVQSNSPNNPTNPNVMRPAAPSPTGRLNSKGQAKQQSKAFPGVPQQQAKQGSTPQAGSGPAPSQK